MTTTQIIDAASLTLITCACIGAAAWHPEASYVPALIQAALTIIAYLRRSPLPSQGAKP